jgi:hypothetical protein
MVQIAYEHIHHKFTNGNRNWDRGQSSNSRRVYQDGRALPLKSIPQGDKGGPIVLFGFFQVEEVSKPAVVEDAAKLFLIADPDSRMVGATQAISGDIAFLLERLWDMSSKSCNDAPTPPLQYQLFLFILQMYSNLKLCSNAFNDGRNPRLYFDDLIDSLIFCKLDRYAST